MAYPILNAGDRNLAVRAMQNALHRALFKKNLPHRNARNGSYGANTVKDVTEFEKAYGVRPVSGRTFGPRGWTALKPFLSKTDRRYIARYNAQITAKRAREAALAIVRRESVKRRKVADVAIKAWQEGRHVYRQIRPMAPGLFHWTAYSRTDCSSFATLCFKEAGCPDPNGFGYNGYGFTGTMDARSSRGEWVTSPVAGDFAFYGRSRWSTSHMAVHISADEVISFGSTPIRKLNVRYRNDYVGSKRFPVF